MQPFRQEEKVYFKAGDLVVFKHDLPGRPVMFVEGKEQTLIKQDDSSHFKGMRCIWFTKDFKIEKYVFSTKDLEFYDPYKHDLKQN